MSQLFTGILVRPFVGAPFNFRNNICTAPTMPPLAVPITIDWSPYWVAAGNPANLGLAIDLQQYVNVRGAAVPATNAQSNDFSGRQLIDQIRSIKIDNSQSTASISVVMDDTLDVITAPPNTVVWLPIVTNGFTFRVYAQNLAAGFIPRTNIFLFNTPTPAVIDPQIQTTFPQELGSRLIQGFQERSGYAPRALGDQFSFAALPLQILTATAPFPGLAGTAVQWIYITHINIHCQGVSELSQVALRISGNQIMQFNLGPSNGGPASYEVCNLSGMNLRYSANNAVVYLQVDDVSAAGAIVGQIGFTIGDF